MSRRAIRTFQQQVAAAQAEIAQATTEHAQVVKQLDIIRRFGGSPKAVAEQGEKVRLNNLRLDRANAQLIEAEANLALARETKGSKSEGVLFGGTRDRGPGRYATAR